jgi:hypothetical protein
MLLPAVSHDKLPTTTIASILNQRLILLDASTNLRRGHKLQHPSYPGLFHLCSDFQHRLRWKYGTIHPRQCHSNTASLPLSTTGHDRLHNHSNDNT